MIFVVAGLQEEIEEAARLSNAHAFIMALPRGYSTLVPLGPPFPSNANDELLHLSVLLSVRPFPFTTQNTGFGW